MTLVQEVLNEAIAAGGSSVSDYVDSNGDAGFFQFQHRVYGREGEPCLVCRTPIKRIVIAGRSAHYCPEVPEVVSSFEFQVCRQSCPEPETLET